MVRGRPVWLVGKGDRASALDHLRTGCMGGLGHAPMDVAVGRGVRAQVAIGMLVWNLFDARGRGWLAGAVAAAIFMMPTIALWRAKPLFVGRPPS